jgi:hypothetical protein
LWGPSHYPVASIDPVTDRAPTAANESKESHLRSTGGLSGYDVLASDGEIGYVSGLVLEEETWAIRYVEVATRNFWPGRKVLISPDWIQRVNWLSSKVYLAMVRPSICVY